MKPLRHTSPLPFQYGPCFGYFAMEHGDFRMWCSAPDWVNDSIKAVIDQVIHSHRSSGLPGSVRYVSKVSDEIP